MLFPLRPVTSRNGVGDAGADWFGTVTLDNVANLVSANISAKGYVFDEVNQPVAGSGNTMNPVSGVFNTWILAEPYANGPTQGLQFWDGTSFYWSFDTDCGSGGG